MITTEVQKYSEQLKALGIEHTILEHPRLIEVEDVPIRIAAGGGQKTNLGVGLLGLAQDITVQCQVVRLHRKAASAHRNDLTHGLIPYLL